MQPSAKPAKSVQFNLPTESSSHSAIKSEEDIKNMQKEKLDLYNQRILEKRDQDKRNMVVARKTQDKNKDGSLVSPDGDGEEEKGVKMWEDECEGRG